MITSTRKFTAFLGIAALAALSACGGGGATGNGSGGGDGEAVSITIAEPVHGVGYLPLYAAQDAGFFEEEGLDVEVTTLAGGGHVNATLSGDVWGFIGGPESGAVANVAGADLVTIANVVNRGNVYFVTGGDEDIGIDSSDEELAAFLEGETIAGGRYGGTPNAILRHILLDLGLDPEDDVNLIEVDDSSAIPSTVQSGQAGIAVVAEPQLGFGVQEGLWGEPFINPLDRLGPYAYSSILIPREAIDQEPEVVEGFVRALEKGQELIENDREYTEGLAAAEFPTMDEATLTQILDRAYADNLWEGTYLSEDAVEMALEVARSGNILSDDANPQDFDTIATNEFVSRTE